jgi:hypothetical protein
MIAKYRITRDDYIKAARLFRKFTPRRIFAYLAVTLLLLIIAFLGPDFVREGIIGGLIGGAIASLVIRYLLFPYLTKRNYRKYKAMHDEFSLQIEENGLRFGSSTGEGLVKWDTIYKWRQNDEYILIYPMPRLYHIIPKAIGKDGFDIQAVAESLCRNVGKDR